MRSRKELVEEYKILQKKYQLPDFETLDKQFDIRIFDEGYVLIDILNKIQEKVEDYAEFLTSLLNLDSDIINLTESKYISDVERLEIFELLRKFMSLSKEIQILSIENNETNIAKFIKNLDIEDNKIIGILQKLKKGWDENTIEDIQKAGYLG